jgi:hypothetical protein
MKVKELIAILQNINPETQVLIADNGSIMYTGSAQETLDYNKGNDTDEFFVVAEEWQ